MKISNKKFALVLGGLVFFLVGNQDISESCWLINVTTKSQDVRALLDEFLNESRLSIIRQAKDDYRVHSGSLSYDKNRLIRLERIRMFGIEAVEWIEFLAMSKDPSEKKEIYNELIRVLDNFDTALEDLKTYDRQKSGDIPQLSPGPVQLKNIYNPAKLESREWRSLPKVVADRFLEALRGYEEGKVNPTVKQAIPNNYRFFSANGPGGAFRMCIRVISAAPLSYELIKVGPHENFYDDIRRKL